MEKQQQNNMDITQSELVTTFQNRVEKLERILNTQNQLLLIMSHDLRSPFNSILGFSRLLLEKKDQFDDETYRLIKTIHSQAESTFNLLESLTEWARTQSEGSEICLRNVDVSRLVEEVVAPYARAACSKDISIDYTGGCLDNLYTDREIIRIILANLVSNAIKFTCPAGKINIYSRKGNGTVEITVLDSGIGMSRECIANLFRVGKEFSSVGTANENGSGVGLSLCKELVARLDGHIRVESELGKGSKFTVSFPEQSVGK